MKYKGYISAHEVQMYCDIQQIRLDLLAELKEELKLMLWLKYKHLFNKQLLYIINNIINNILLDYERIRANYVEAKDSVHGRDIRRLGKIFTISEPNPRNATLSDRVKQNTMGSAQRRTAYNRSTPIAR
jgi:hypothetical protein